MMFLEGSSGGVWMQSRWYGPKPCWSSPRPSSALCSRSFLLILIFPALPSSTAWSIYITDLFILFQDNFHHCSKCIWKERPACHVAADIRKREKNTSFSANVFSLLACGAAASFNFNQMPDKGGVVENKWSLICGVSCKQESTSQFPFASCCCFLPALVRESFPLSLLWRHCLSSLFPSYSAVAT